MALSKNITLENGVATNYHRVVSMNTITNIQNIIEVASYTSKEKREEEQYAIESKGTGVFTNLLVDALYGAASNLIGDVTPGSVYAHIDQSLGAWEQRPIFKTNVNITPNIINADVTETIDITPIVLFFIRPFKPCFIL